jgi:hypothetical protein
MAVKDLNTKLFGTKHDVLALAGRYVVSNFSSVFLVVHEKEFELSNVVHREFVEAIGEKVSSFLVGTVTINTRRK